MIAKGQRIELPQGQYNRVCLLAASVEGDQKAVFEAGAHKAELNVEKWSGFAGQWDDRVWSSSDTELGNYGQMVRLRPGFIKRADLAWYSDHHRTPRKKHVPYSCSYLFAYGIDLPSGADWAGQQPCTAQEPLRPPPLSDLKQPRVRNGVSLDLRIE